MGIATHRMSRLLRAAGACVAAVEPSRHPLGLGIALALVLLALLFPYRLTGNEEHYFQLAHRAVAPDAFPA